MSRTLNMEMQNEVTSKPLQLILLAQDPAVCSRFQKFLQELPFLVAFYTAGADDVLTKLHYIKKKTHTDVDIIFAQPELLLTYPQLSQTIHSSFGTPLILLTGDHNLCASLSADDLLVSQGQQYNTELIMSKIGQWRGHSSAFNSSSAQNRPDFQPLPPDAHPYRPYLHGADRSSFPPQSPQNTVYASGPQSPAPAWYGPDSATHPSSNPGSGGRPLSPQLFRDNPTPNSDTYSNNNGARPSMPASQQMALGHSGSAGSTGGGGNGAGSSASDLLAQVQALRKVLEDKRVSTGGSRPATPSVPGSPGVEGSGVGHGWSWSGGQGYAPSRSESGSPVGSSSLNGVSRTPLEAQGSAEGPSGMSRSNSFVAVVPGGTRYRPPPNRSPLGGQSLPDLQTYDTPVSVSGSNPGGPGSRSSSSLGYGDGSMGGNQTGTAYGSHPSPMSQSQMPYNSNTQSPNGASSPYSAQYSGTPMSNPNQTQLFGSTDRVSANGSGSGSTGGYSGSSTGGVYASGLCSNSNNGNSNGSLAGHVGNSHFNQPQPQPQLQPHPQTYRSGSDTDSRVHNTNYQGGSGNADHPGESSSLTMAFKKLEAEARTAGETEAAEKLLEASLSLEPSANRPRDTEATHRSKGDPVNSSLDLNPYKTGRSVSRPAGYGNGTADGTSSLYKALSMGQPLVMQDPNGRSAARPETPPRRRAARILLGSHPLVLTRGDLP